MASGKDKLNPQQLAFVDSYMVHFNKTRAAIDAGYSSPTHYGWQLIQKPHIKEEISRRSAEYSEAKAALKERIIEELCCVAFSNLEDIGRFGPSGFDIKEPKEIPQSVKRAIAEFSVNETDKAVNAKVRLHNKTQALDLLSKILQMHKENEVSVNVKPYIIERRDGTQLELGVQEN